MEPCTPQPEAGKGKVGDADMSNGKGSHDPFVTSEEFDLKRKLPSHLHDCRFGSCVTRADVTASVLMDIRKAKAMGGNKGTGKAKDDDNGTGKANDKDDQATGKAKDKDDDKGTCKANDKDGTGTGKAKGKDVKGTSSQGGKGNGGRVDGWLRYDEIIAKYPQEDYSMAWFPQTSVWARPGMPTLYLINPKHEQ